MAQCYAGLASCWAGLCRESTRELASLETISEPGEVEQNEYSDDEDLTSQRADTRLLSGQRGPLSSRKDHGPSSPVSNKERVPSGMRAHLSTWSSPEEAREARSLSSARGALSSWDRRGSCARQASGARGPLSRRASTRPAPEDGRIPMGILGGTGLVGRHFAAVLLNHPIFCLGPVVGSSQTIGGSLEDVWVQKESTLEKHYGPALWKAAPFPEGLRGIKVASIDDLKNSTTCKYVMSAIAPALGHLEDELQALGFAVFSISPHARQNPRNPLVVPEANFETLLPAMRVPEGRTIPLLKSPNCVTCGVSIVLKALDETYGVEGVSVSTFQALSGRGDAKYEPSLVVGNVYPLTGTVERTDEFQKRELMKILPNIERAAVSAHRVPVQTGHFADVKVQTRKPVTSVEEAKDVLHCFNPLKGLGFPSQPDRPIVVLDEVGRPRPLQDADYEGGMAVAVGNVRCNDGFFDVTVSVVINNVVRGAWGAALINAELYELTVVPKLAALEAEKAVAEKAVESRDVFSPRRLKMREADPEPECSADAPKSRDQKVVARDLTVAEEVELFFETPANASGSCKECKLVE